MPSMKKHSNWCCNSRTGSDLDSFHGFTARRRDRCSSHHLFGCCKKCMQIWMTSMQLLSFCQFSHVVLWFNDWMKSTCSGLKVQIFSQRAPPQCCQAFSCSKRLNKQLTQKVEFFTNDTPVILFFRAEQQHVKLEICTTQMGCTNYQVKRLFVHSKDMCCENCMVQSFGCTKVFACGQ